MAQEDLNTFLAVAEDLKVKGLTQNQAGSNSSSRPTSKPEVKQPKPPDREFKRSAPAGRPHTMAEPEDDDIQEVMPVKTEPAPSQAELYQQDPQQAGGQLQQFDEGAMEYGDYEDYGHQYDESGQQLVEGVGGEAGKGTDLSLLNIVLGGRYQSQLAISDLLIFRNTHFNDLMSSPDVTVHLV